MAGGLVTVPDSWPISGDIHVLYSWWLIPGYLKYDQVVHAFGFGVTTWVIWQGLRSSAGITRPTVGVLAVLSIGWWVSTVIKAHGNQQPLPARFVGFVATHVLIFMTGYIFIQGLDEGWLVLNVWHNAQYILFVWRSNTKRFEDGVDPKRRLISYISQSDRIVLYMAICLFLAVLTYSGIELLGRTFPLESLIGLSFLLVMTINFHHYIVDGLIWKRRGRRPEPAAA